MICSLSHFIVWLPVECVRPQNDWCTFPFISLSLYVSLCLFEFVKLSSSFPRWRRFAFCQMLFVECIGWIMEWNETKYLCIIQISLQFAISLPMRLLCSNFENRHENMHTVYINCCYKYSDFKVSAAKWKKRAGLGCYGYFCLMLLTMRLLTFEDLI